MLVFPVVLIQWCNSDVLAATYLMLFAVSLFLKMTSFHHVCYDNRYLIKRIEQVKQKEKKNMSDEDLATMFNVNEATFKIAAKYPDNIDVKHFVRFLFAPTCCYQHTYPTSPSIRVGYCVKRVLEFSFCYVFMWYLIH